MTLGGRWTVGYKVGLRAISAPIMRLKILNSITLISASHLSVLKSKSLNTARLQKQETIKSWFVRVACDVCTIAFNKK